MENLKSEYKFTKKYKIVVTEICDEETLTKKDWKKGAGKEGPDNWGYTPQVKSIEKVTREIYSQNVSELNLRAVIEAVNGKIDYKSRVREDLEKINAKQRDIFDKIIAKEENIT